VVSPVNDKIIYMDTWEAMSKLHTDPIMAITEWYFESRNRMKYPSPYSKNRKRNADKEYGQIKLLINKDGYSLEEILTLLSFAISDTFWGRTGLQSLTSIRKPNIDGLRKIESIKGGYLRKIQREESMKKYGKNKKG
jgi:hypothetical protein